MQRAFLWGRAGLVAWLLGAAGVAQAQDVVTVAPGIYRSVMENNRMRVLEATLKPGAKIGLHSHPDHMIYMLTPGTVVLKPPGRTPYEMTHKVGEAIYLAGQTRALENDTNQTIRLLIVEMKEAPPPAARRGAARQQRGGKRARPRKR